MTSSYDLNRRRPDIDVNDWDTIEDSINADVSEEIKMHMVAGKMVGYNNCIDDIKAKQRMGASR